MGSGQQARVSAGETIAEFMQRRSREVASRDKAEAAGRGAWVTSTSTGESLLAPRTSDIVALGARALAPQTASEQRNLAATNLQPRTRQSVPPSYQRSGVSISPRPPGRSAISRYGSLYAPPPDDLAELRRQQAAFGRTRRELDRQNSWLAVPALAPIATVIGFEGAATVAGRALGGGAIKAPLRFLDREAWQSGAERAAQALTVSEKDILRGAARTKLARANGISTSEMQAEVHHSDPLEWAHLKPKADPNRLANLWGLRKEAHAIATREWGAFNRELRGRLPTQAELMDAKLRIDRMVEPYVRRAGLPRSNRPPGKGGPI